MAVCRKRSTNMAPDFLSTSYLTGAPPCGISMMTLTSCGGFSPTLMLERSIGPLSLRYGGTQLIPSLPRARRKAQMGAENRITAGNLLVTWALCTAKLKTPTKRRRVSHEGTPQYHHLHGCN